MKPFVIGRVSAKKGQKSGLSSTARRIIAKTKAARASITAIIKGTKSAGSGIVLGARRKTVRRRPFLTA